LPGAQLRYLVHSSRHGYVGALSFSGSSWTLKDRDKHIGWSDRAREAHIQEVISNSRFLILPHIRVPNLASHTLSLSVKRVQADWKGRYGISPLLLETFVNPRRFTGCSYKAANWTFVGKTAGRRGSERKDGETPKDIYVYPLAENWQEMLREEPAARLERKRETAHRGDWAEEELSNANFYDPRLGKRLIELARDFFKKPLSGIPQSCDTKAKIKAAYRFFKNKRVNMERILRPHIESTVERIREHKVVICAQDTSSLNYTTLSSAEGFGPIGSSKASSMGLILHDTMSFSSEGVPLGLLDMQVWARDGDDRQKKHRRGILPIEEKESVKWLKSYRATAEAQKLCPDTTLISVGDRESDLYDLFHEASLDPSGPKLIVRCERSRKRKADNVKLWNRMEREPVAGTQLVEIPRRGADAGRKALLEIRHAKVSLSPPARGDYTPLDAWMVYALETEESAKGATRLEWMLHSTVQVNNLDNACECLAWYAKRWGIEIYHRTLKSGCKIEDRQLGSADSLEACLAIDLIVAWRVFHLTMLGRETPELPCTVFFDDMEWKALYLFRKKTSVLPDKTPSLWEATLMVASLGGFIGRKGDGKPGTTVIWRGLQRLDDIHETYAIMLPSLRAGP